MPRLDGIEATRRILAQVPGVHVLVLTSFADEPHVRRAIAAGAHGFLLKEADPRTLAEAVRTVARGEALLAPRATRRRNRWHTRRRPHRQRIASICSRP